MLLANKQTSFRPMQCFGSGILERSAYAYAYTHTSPSVGHIGDVYLRMRVCLCELRVSMRAWEHRLNVDTHARALAQVSGQEYDVSAGALSNKFIHLTNASIQSQKPSASLDALLRFFHFSLQYLSCVRKICVCARKGAGVWVPGIVLEVCVGSGGSPTSYTLTRRTPHAIE